MNDNKLIAEFMEVHEIMHDGYSEYDFDDNTLDVVAEDELQYHTSWDWLMPVLRNISDTAKLYELPEDSNLIEDITNGLVSIDIEMTFEAVVEFIKEFNQTHTL